MFILERRFECRYDLRLGTTGHHHLGAQISDRQYRTRSRVQTIGGPPSGSRTRASQTVPSNFFPPCRQTRSCLRPLSRSPAVPEPGSSRRGIWNQAPLRAMAISASRSAMSISRPAPSSCTSSRHPVPSPGAPCRAQQAVQHLITIAPILFSRIVSSSESDFLRRAAQACRAPVAAAHLSFFVCLSLLPASLEDATAQRQFAVAVSLSSLRGPA